MNNIVIMQVFHCQYNLTDYEFSNGITEYSELIQFVIQVSLIQILHTKADESLMSETIEWFDHKIPFDQLEYHILILKTLNVVQIVLFCVIDDLHSIYVICTLLHHFPYSPISTFTNLLQKYKVFYSYLFLLLVQLIHILYLSY
jgi:hypothetical protein